MTNQTEKRIQIKAVLATLCRLFGRSDDDSLLDFMVSRLEDFEPQALSAALNTAAVDRLRAGESLLGMVLRHLNGDPDEVMELAWTAAQEAANANAAGTAVGFVDPAIGEAVAALGGPTWIHQQDAIGLAQLRKEFALLYRAKAAQHPKPDLDAIRTAGELFGADTWNGKLTVGSSPPPRLPATVAVPRLGRDQHADAVDALMDSLSGEEDPDGAMNRDEEDGRTR